jgi:hypothetical protein
MTILSAPPVADENVDIGVRRHLWTHAEVLRALELGLFSPEQRMELIAGELIDKMTRNRPHGISLSKSQYALATAFGDTFYISVRRHSR